MDSIGNKLFQLRQLMQQEGVDYYYIPNRDEHNNEYVPDCWQRRQWLTGFTGSAGDALVGMQTALLWTDSRYFLQAEQQLDPQYFQLMKLQPGTPSMGEWLKQQPKGLRLGVDAKLVSIKQAKEWQAILTQHNGQLVALSTNLIDQLWQDQPEILQQPVILQAQQFTGMSVAQKLDQLRQQLRNLSVGAHVITSLDIIAWLFNIRGSDIQYNPMALSYALVTLQQATLFINLNKLSPELRQELQQQGVVLVGNDKFAAALSALSGPVLLDANHANWWVQQQLKQTEIVVAPSPVSMMKAIKNANEQQGMREAHIEDAIALIKFFCWLELHWQHGLNELSAALQLEQFRREHSSCVGLSFATISAFAEHGAIVHYQPTAATSKIIDNTNLYLVDSGGQYVNGTTDVTRTLHLGAPTAQQQQHYTLVLKGHLALRHAIFPHGTCGYQLDSLARQFLWQAGLDYGHGTGHGVGCYLCVHEGPHGISSGPNSVALVPGMMVSNEPGVYLAGQYGIRIENVCQIVESLPGFYTLADLTLVPYAVNLLARNLLSEQEINWINEYHQLIYQQLALRLPEAQRRWLRQATQVI